MNIRQNIFTNPILAGGYPDPSICRVGDDFYIVNSSFEYFPGLPIHHSKDLVNWELVGYGLHRPEQCVEAVNLVDVQTKGGIHAPTIRFHEGIFYIITTNVYLPPSKNEDTQFINFVITAKNIAGPWSAPHVLAGAPGIDPDIFFDDDGKVWYVGTHSPANPNFAGEGEIWLQEIDLENWSLIGERYYLWRGACRGVWVEGPHIYKRRGKYYLLVAEGGTSFNHAVMIAMSDYIRGPYISNPRNPILTTRHLSYHHWVNSTGHADLVELSDGRWYMVTLGIRGDEEQRSNMGRETHLVPVIWEKEPFEWQAVNPEWPVCAPETGRVERNNPVPFENTQQYRNDAFYDNFDTPKLDLQWNFRRVPRQNTYSLSARKGHLRLFAFPERIQERAQYSFLGIRQRESDFEYRVCMNFTPDEDGAEAGVCLLQQDDNYLTFTVKQEQGQRIIQLEYKAPSTAPQIICKKAIQYSDEIVLQIVSKDQRYRYSYSTENRDGYHLFTETAATHLLSKGYTGSYLGIFATTHGKTNQAYADFDWVQYKGFQR